MKKTVIFCAAVLLFGLLAAPASAVDYTIAGADGGTFGTPTSIESVFVSADSDKLRDMSKDGAVMPPAFGAAIGASGTAVGASAVLTVPQTRFTEFTDELYGADGSVGTLEIPSLGLRVKVYEGTDGAQLDKGVGHFPSTSIWDGNVAIAGHNRGVNSYFGRIHTLKVGDEITLTTALGSRTYAVRSVTKIAETDSSVLAAAADDCLTLITCVRGESAYRWCVRAAAT